MEKKIKLIIFSVLVFGILFIGMSEDVSAWCNKLGKVSCEACGCPGGGGGGGCSPSCGECGPDDCGGTCTDTCGNYKSGCDAKTCTYFAASLTANVDTPCISQKLNSREFTVSGRSKYCGEIKIKVKDTNGDNIIPVTTVSTTDKFGDYVYTETLTLPANLDLSPEPVINIIVVGDRQATKNGKDEPNYAETCKKELHLELDYKNFFYCPVNPETRIDVTTYDYYDDSSHYEFNGGLAYTQWDSDSDCVSEDSVNLCSSKPTDCVSFEIDRSSCPDPTCADDLVCKYVEKFKELSITIGCDSENYCPDRELIRTEVAVLILKAIGESPATTCQGTVFGDVDNTVPGGDLFCRYIEKFEALGITTGCGSGNYCPLDLVTRADIAVLILKAIGESPATTCQGTVFGDVDNTVPGGDLFCRYIEKFEALGITTGCGSGNYCPNRAATRAEAAILILNAIGESPNSYCLGDMFLDVQPSGNCPLPCTPTSSYVSKPRNSVLDADNDGEIEVCLSRDGIQGGWIDADINNAACQKVNALDNRVAKWYSCPNPSDRECAEGVDGFPNDQKGLCCGDDLGEGPLDTKFAYPGSTSFLIVNGEELSHDACCDVSDPTQGSCVDELGFCRQVNYDTCFTTLSVADTGFRGTCKKNSLDDYYWELVEDPFCMGVCQKCDVNDDDVVDITDITAIQLNATDPTDLNPVIDPIYDIDGNGVVDESDWERCSMEDVFLFQCNSCESFVEEGADVCANVDGTIKFGQADPYLCSENDGNHTVRIRDETYCGPACDMKYDVDSCNTAACGGCEADSDCELDEFCNTDSCSCQRVECRTGESLCIDGTCSSDCETTDTGILGCIDENYVCEVGEGCACPDCLYQQSICIQGAECDLNGLCGCPADTTLCVDGTCSSDCEITDTGNQGCIGIIATNPNQVIDFSGRGNHGLINGASITSSGRFGKGMEFDGLNDYISLPFGYAKGSISETTVCAWVKSNSEQEQIIISFDRSEVWRLAMNDDQGGFVGWDTTDEKTVADETLVTKDLFTSESYSDGDWHFICGWYKKGASPDKKLFIDGDLKLSSTDHDNYKLGQGIERARSFGFIGVGSESPEFDGVVGPEYYFNGTMDEVKIYNRALSDAEVLKGYQGKTVSNQDMKLHYSFDDILGDGIANGICEAGEGCACIDCLGDQDSCLAGLLCGENELCNCIPNEEYEVTLNDGQDNDCDGLVDEPYFDGYGVYVWESNCDYYMCVYSDELVDMITYGSVSSSTSFSNIRKLDWENNVDTLTVDTANTVFDFRSRINYDLDCVIMNTDGIMNFELNLSGVDGTDNIYLKQVKMNPLTNPFYFSSPTCALGCETPGMCGEEKQVLISTIKVGCGYDECIFDCGGHWVDVESSYDSIPATLLDSPEDYCAACEADMACSDYTNEYSCHYNPCTASETRYGCDWDADEEVCFDPFVPCMPGTTLCDDGVCREDCSDDDTNIAYCYGYPDDVCEVGEGCACPDCTDDQASCTDGAVCDDNMICGCPIGTALCEDKTCSDDCDDSDKQGCIDTNGICEFGEGCTCIDCNAQKDSCVYGAVCSRYEELCIELQIENCDIGETICEDFSCDETCADNGGKRGCVGDPNEICEFGEGCECSDCYNKQDSCKVGLVCDDDDYVCKSTSSGGGSITDDDCTDLDNDGYSKLDSNCAGSSDCDDTDELVNVAAIEICGNQVDDNCDGSFDEDCISSIDVTVGEKDEIRVFDAFDLVVKVNNKLPYEVKKVKFDMDLPKGISSKKQSYNIVDLSANSETSQTMRIYVKDYELEEAVLELNIDVDGEIVTKEIELEVIIPEFLVAADPVDIDSGATCYDLYYVINMGEVKGDIELNVIDPDAILSKTALIDYIRGVQTSGILMEELVSNPYCLPQRKNYEVQGYFYKANSGFFIDKSIKSDQSLVDESRTQIMINIDLNEV